MLVLLLLQALTTPARATTLRTGQRAAAAPTFCNPLNLAYRFQPDLPSRREAADPTMVVFENKYFLFASKSGGYWHSPDLNTWTLVEPQGLPLEDYAPTALVLDGRMYYTASNSQGIFTTDDPVKGVWTKVAPLDKYWDPSLFLDDDGRVYLTWGCSNADAIRIAELDPKQGWKVVSTPVIGVSGHPETHGWERFTDWRSKVLSEKPFIEGSWMNKVNGRYYLQYAAPGTEMKAYGDGVYVSDSPTGPFKRDPGSPFSHKPTGFMGGAGHGSTFKDLQGRWWHVGTGIVNVRHNMERRVMLYPAYFNSSAYPAYFKTAGAAAAAPSLVVDTTFGDFPMRVDQTRPGWQLLSLGKKVTASSVFLQSLAELTRDEFSGNVWNSPPHLTPRSHDPSHAVDENVKTWWSAASSNPGEWLAVDLGSPETVHAVQVNFADESAHVLGRLRDAYKYYAEYSLDGQTWKSLQELDRRDNDQDAPHDYVELQKPLVLQHFRVTSTHVPGGARFSVSDLRLFGFGSSSSPQEVPAPQVTRDLHNQQRARVSWPTSDGAQYYVVRYGPEGGPHFHNYQVYGSTSLDMDSLSVGEKYGFVVDAVSEAGWTVGTQETRA